MRDIALAAACQFYEMRCTSAGLRMWSARPLLTRVGIMSTARRHTSFVVTPPSPSPLDRLLDGVDVAVEPLAVRDAARTAPPVVPGAGLLKLACGACVRFSAQSVAILPPARRSADDEPWRNTRRRGEPPILSAGVRIRVTYQGCVNLFDHLGEPLVERFVADDPLRHCVHELLDEMTAMRPGRCAMTATLLRRLVVLVLRRGLSHRSGLLSWAAAVQDPGLARAVAAMRDRPEHGFTLPELAEVAGMSRSVFAARFANVLARPPIDFLKALRLARAASLLARTDLPIKTIAAQVGYASRSSFTRAFITCHGAAPQAFRTIAPQAAAARVARRATERASRPSPTPGISRATPAL
jgi:AraC-like DNA-binding protein